MLERIKKFRWILILMTCLLFSAFSSSTFNFQSTISSFFDSKDPLAKSSALVKDSHLKNENTRSSFSFLKDFFSWKLKTISLLSSSTREDLPRDQKSRYKMVHDLSQKKKCSPNDPQCQFTSSAIDIVVCSKNLCLSEDYCSFCEQQELVNELKMPTAFIVFNDSNSAKLETLIDVHTSEEQPVIKIKSMPKNVIAVPLKNLKFSSSYDWAMNTKDGPLEFSFSLTLNHLIIPECLIENQLRFGTCSSFEERGSNYGKAKVELKTITPCFKKDFINDMLFKPTASFTAFKDTCSPLWTDNIDSLMHDSLNIDAVQWRTSVMILNEEKDSQRYNVLNTLDEIDSKNAVEFLTALHNLIRGQRSISSVQLSGFEYKDPQSMALLKLNNVSYEKDPASTDNSPLSLLNFSWKKYWRDSDSISETKEISAINFSEAVNFTISLQGNSCSKDLDCKSLCCQKGKCAPHDPTHEFYCNKSAGDTCLGSTFCQRSVRTETIWVQPRKDDIGLRCDLFVGKKYTGFDQCVDFKCVHPGKNDFPYPIKPNISGEELTSEIDKAATDPSNCPTPI